MRSLTIFLEGNKILLTHILLHNLATKDPASGRDISEIRHTPHISLLISPSHIPITSPANLWKVLRKEIEKGGKPITTPFVSPCLQYGGKLLGLQLNTHRETFKALSPLVTDASIQLYGIKGSSKQAAKPMENSIITTQAQSLDISPSDLSKASSEVSLLSLSPMHIGPSAAFLSAPQVRTSPSPPSRQLSQPKSPIRQERYAENPSDVEGMAHASLYTQDLSALVSQDPVACDDRDHCGALFGAFPRGK